MTAPARHPDPEQLAAFAAGEPEVLDPLIIQAHLDVCDTCAADIHALHALETDLAQLEDPELPPGLHDRLIAAVQAETTAHPPGAHPDTAAAPGPDAGHPAAPVTPLPRRPRRHVTARRWLWAAAAAVILLAVVFVGQLEGLTGTVTDSVAGGGQDQPAQEEAGPRATEGGRATPGTSPAAPGQDAPATRSAQEPGTDPTAAQEAPAGSPPRGPDGESRAAQPPSSGGGEPQREVAPEVAPSTERPATESADDPPDDTGDPPDDTDAPRSAPATTTPTAPEGPGVAQADDGCVEAVRADGREVTEGPEEQDGDIVVVAEDPEDPDLVFEYTFPDGDCSAQPKVRQKSTAPFPPAP